MKNNKPNDWNKLEQAWKNLKKGELEFEPTQDELKAIKPIVDALSDWEEPILKPNADIKTRLLKQIAEPKSKSNNRFWIWSTLTGIAATVALVFYLFNSDSLMKTVSEKEVSLNEKVAMPEKKENEMISNKIEDKTENQNIISNKIEGDVASKEIVTHIKPTIPSHQNITFQPSADKEAAKLEEIENVPAPQADIGNILEKETTNQNSMTSDEMVVNSKMKNAKKSTSASNQLASISDWEKLIIPVY